MFIDRSRHSNHNKLRTLKLRRVRCKADSSSLKRIAAQLAVGVNPLPQLSHMLLIHIHTNYIHPLRKLKRQRQPHIPQTNNRHPLPARNNLFIHISNYLFQ